MQRQPLAAEVTAILIIVAIFFVIAIIGKIDGDCNMLSSYIYDLIWRNIRQIINVIWMFRFVIFMFFL